MLYERCTVCVFAENVYAGKIGLVLWWNDFLYKDGFECTFVIVNDFPAKSASIYMFIRDTEDNILFSTAVCLERVWFRFLLYPNARTSYVYHTVTDWCSALFCRKLYQPYKLYDYDVSSNLYVKICYWKLTNKLKKLSMLFCEQKNDNAVG